MKRTRKPSVLSIVFPILLISLVIMILACEGTITVSVGELQARALETCQAEIDYISDALYSQLTSIEAIADIKRKNRQHSGSGTRASAKLGGLLRGSLPF